MEVLVLVLIAWMAAVVLIVWALAIAAHRADAQSDAQWERWARAQRPSPPLRSRRGGLAA